MLGSPLCSFLAGLPAHQRIAVVSWGCNRQPAPFCGGGGRRLTLYRVTEMSTFSGTIHTTVPRYGFWMPGCQLWACKEPSESLQS